MGRVSEAETFRRQRYVLDNYFAIPKAEMLSSIRKALDIDLKERALRNYYRWAENEMIHLGLFDKDKAALRLQLQKTMARYQKIADQAASDEVSFRKHMKKNKLNVADCDPETARTLKDLQYTQINAEKAIVQMLEKAGITAKREEIEINLKAEWFVVFGQAHMAVAYDLIPEDLHELYIQRCRIFEGATFDHLQELVEGKVLLPAIEEHTGGEEDGRQTDEEGTGS
jgi:hypothetical protein